MTEARADNGAEKVDVLLRDEKEYIGILRSYDQFGMEFDYLAKNRKLTSL